MSRGLTFTIYPESDFASVPLFLRAMEHISRLIRDVDFAMTRERAVRKWVIVEMHSSHPTITVRPVIGDDEVPQTIVTGLMLVESGTVEPPPHFTEQVLDDLRRWRTLFKGRDRAKSLTCSLNSHSALLGEDIGRKAERILKGGYWNLGSVEGTLEAVNLHGNPSFTVWDRLSRGPVRCYFLNEQEKKDRVKALLEKRVLVSGQVNYFINGVPKSITHIESVDEASHDPGLPMAGFGSIPWDEAVKDSVEFLAKARGPR